jgi:hypothetical protein
VPLRNAATKLTPRHFALGLAFVLCWHDHVDTERLAADLFSDPGEIDVKRFRRMGFRTQDAQAPRFAHSHDHVAAMGERDDRELDPKHLTDGVLH